MKFTLSEAEISAAVKSLVQQKLGSTADFSVEFVKPRTGELSAEIDIDLFGAGKIAPVQEKPQPRAATKAEVKEAVAPKPENTPVEEDKPPFEADPVEKESLFGPN